MAGRGPAHWRATVPDWTFRSGLDRAAYQAGVERIRDHVARGDIYQANLTRRLETPFDGDPWELYRRLRTGDPSLFSAYLDLGPGQLTGRPRAILSASPEPFLSVDAQGVGHDGPDQGHPTARTGSRRGPGASPASCSRAPRTAPRT